MTASARAEGTADDDPTVLERDPRLCQHGRKDGSLCNSYAVNRDNGGTACAAHSGLGVAANPKGAAKRSAEVRQAKAGRRSEARERAAMSTKDVVVALVEDLQNEIREAFRLAITEGDPAAIRRAEAAERLLSRVYGKPTERVETTVTTPESVEEYRSMTPDQRQRALTELEERRAARQLREAEEA